MHLINIIWLYCYKDDNVETISQGKGKESWCNFVYFSVIINWILNVYTTRPMWHMVLIVYLLE